MPLSHGLKWTPSQANWSCRYAANFPSFCLEAIRCLFILSYISIQIHKKTVITKETDAGQKKEFRLF